MLSFIQLLIMAFTALDTTHHSNRNRFVFAKQFVNLLKVSIVGIPFKVNVGTLVALYTPFHSKWRVLINFFHLLYLTVASLAFLFPCYYVLRVIEIYKVGQVMNTYPLNRPCLGTVVFLSLRIITQGIVYFLYFSRCCFAV